MNIVLLQLIAVPMLIAHELGHAIAVRCLGMKLIKISIGSGKILFTLRLLGVLWEIKQFSIKIKGLTLYSGKSTHLYRLKVFLITLSGPLANFLLILLELQFPSEITLKAIPETYLFPGIAFYIVNVLAIISSLFPDQVEIDGIKYYSDGLKLLTVPFLSKQKILHKIALSYVLDGGEWERRGNHEQAIISFSEAVQKDPTCLQAYQGRGNAYQIIEDYQKAIDDLNQAIELDPQNAISYFLRGIAYFNWRKTDPTKLHNAIEDLNQAIYIEPNTEAFYSTRAASYTYIGEEIQAIEDFTKVIQLSPTTASYYNRGVVYYHCRNYQAALEDLNQAIEINNNDISAYYSRSNAKYELQDETGALQDYNKAEFLSSTETIHPQDEHGFYARGIAYVRSGNIVEAMNDLQTAETLCLENGDIKLLQQAREEIKKISDAP